MAAQTISHYRITAKLGEGGMGVVYKAEDLKLKRTVALKFLRTDALENEERKTRFLREAQAAASLNHPNICTIYEIDEADGRSFIAMEYIDGQSLKDKIKSRPLKLEEALEIAIQAGEGLQEAHEKGITHRDIKSANIMLAGKGKVKVTDFGLAHLAGRSKLTKFGSTLGTLAYMSPEQARGEPTDCRTDIWALGVVLYEMISGQLPFKGEFDAAVLYSILNEDPQPLTVLRGSVPVEIDRIVGKAMAKRAEERYQHVDELLVDLRSLEKRRESVLSQRLPSQAVVPRRKRPRWHLAVAALLGALILGAVVWLGFLRPGPEAPQASMQVVPLTSYPGTEQHPSFSPDGNQVAFSWNGESQDNFDIYVKLIGSETPLRLTNNPASDRDPAWSPDGRSIAFLRQKAEGAVGVLLVPPIGGSERELAEILVPEGTSVAWSPDGKYLAVQGRSLPEQPPGIFLLSVEKGEKWRLTLPPAQAISDRAPAFSPDGRTVAFERYSAVGLADIYLVPVTGGEPTRLTFFGGDPRGLAWTSDGREIVFSRRGGLWRIPSSGGTPRRLLGLGDNPTQPAVSRRGKRLAYTRRVSNTNIWRIDTQASEGRQPAKFISSTQMDAAPQFSPDGKRIVFVSQRSGSWEIWVCDSDGSNPLQLTSMGGGSPRWSPDNRRIVFDSVASGNPDIYVVSASGGPPRRITTHASEEVVPSCSTDGHWIYFASNRTGERQVWKIPVEAETGEASSAVQVTKHGGFAALESPDGKFVYYAKSRGLESAIWRVPVEGGEETPVIESLASRWGNWIVVDEGIYFVDRQGGSSSYRRWILQFLSFDEGRVSQVAELDDPPWIEGRGISVSPDGRWILYVKDESRSDLMVVEGFE